MIQWHRAMKQQTLSIAEKKEALQRVLGSMQFRKAARLRDFLEFVGSRALNGQTEEIHETDIGRAVYHRREDYTPAEDSIVRVEARSLRKKLAAYYESEGVADPVLITIPKGSYLPSFNVRGADAQDLPQSPKSWLPASRLAIFLTFALLVSLAGNLWLASSRRSEPAGTVSQASEPEATNPLWSAIFPPRGETHIVVADSLFTVVQDLAQRPFSLEDYLRPDFPPADAFAGAGDPPGPLARQIFWHQYTSFADTLLAARFMQLPVAARANTSIHFARNTHPRDFKGRNVILLGSSRSNPWYELFEPRLNFRFEYDYESGTPRILNKAPRENEQTTYAAERSKDGTDKVYAVISLVRNLTNDGYVLMIAGTRMEGTEAAGELLLNPASAADMIRTLGLESDGKVRPFEILVESSRMAGTSQGAVVVAQRVPAAP